MNITTIEEIKKFCMNNAGKMASGSNIKSQHVKGRIIAFDLDKKVLLEIEGSAKNPKIPNPLPSIPYRVGEWYRVIADCGTGVSISWASLKLLEGDDAIDVLSKPMPSMPSSPPSTYVEAKRSGCGHEECLDGWCHRRYAGIGYL